MKKKLAIIKKAIDILETALTKNDRNLLLKQSIIDFKKNNNQILSFYDPKKFDDNISEIFIYFQIYISKEMMNFQTCYYQYH